MLIIGILKDIVTILAVIELVQTGKAAAGTGSYPQLEQNWRGIVDRIKTVVDLRLVFAPYFPMANYLIQQVASSAIIGLDHMALVFRSRL